MGSNDDTSSASVEVHKFGDEDLSDVTFIVGGEEFKCHKMFLATRSSYFKAMFYSEFKEKNQDKVTIEADPIAFKRLMELVYRGKLSGWPDLDDCGYDSCYHCRNHKLHVRNYVPPCAGLGTLWEDVNALMQQADLYDIRSYTVTALENCLLGATNCGCFHCPRAGTKLIIALMYDMEKYKAKNIGHKGRVPVALDYMNNVNVTLSSENLKWLLKQEM